MTHDVASSLNRATAMLQEGETDTPRLDAEVLMSHLLQKGRSWLLAHPEQALSEAESDRFFQWIDERVQGLPVAYLTEKREFWSLNLRITPEVLIPRPETELLVEQGLQLLSNVGAQVLDLGTGSGAIALALAKERPDIQITAIDRSSAAIKVASDNAAMLDIPGVHFQVSDWFSQLNGASFDLILCNPPYVAEDDEHLLGEVRYEPKQALVAGEDGLADLRHITAASPGFLVPDGTLLVEHGHQQSRIVQRLFQAAGFSQVETIPDLAGLPRVTGGKLITVETSFS